MKMSLRKHRPECLRTSQKRTLPSILSPDHVGQIAIFDLQTWWIIQSFCLYIQAMKKRDQFYLMALNFQIVSNLL